MANDHSRWPERGGSRVTSAELTLRTVRRAERVRQGRRSRRSRIPADVGCSGPWALGRDAVPSVPSDQPLRVSGGVMTKVVVVYESMYGNTHLIADAIGKGFGQAVSAEIVVVPVGEAASDLLDSADLIVVGGPTHAHGMSRRQRASGSRGSSQLGRQDLSRSRRRRTRTPGLVRESRHGAGAGGSVRHTLQGTRCPHRARFEAHRPGARRAWVHAHRRSGELPRDQGQPSRNRRGGASSRVGRTPRGADGTRDAAADNSRSAIRRQPCERSRQSGRRG